MTIASDVTGSGRASLADRIDPVARTRLTVRERAGLQVVEARLPGPFRVMFTTRLGGASNGPYASLNLNPRSQDDPDRVRGNRALIAAAIADDRSDPGYARYEPAVSRDVALARTPDGGLAVPDIPEREGPQGGRQGYRLVSPMQVHGVRVVGAAEYVAAHGAAGADGVFTDACDGLTLHPELDRGLAALLLFADCVPVVLVGEVDMAVAHAGWRGLLGGIIEQAGGAMTGPPGLAVIGPSLGPCCFTAGAEVADAFVRRFGPEAAGEGTVDLWAAAAVALRGLGVAPAQIVNPRLCTACNRDLFYSYRAEGPETGRHGCVAWTATS